MGHLLQVIAEEGVLAIIGVINDLVWQHKALGTQVTRRDATDGVDGNDARNPGLLERPNIGAVVDAVRRDSVAGAVARQEYHLLAVPTHRIPRAPRVRHTACASPRDA